MLIIDWNQKRSYGVRTYIKRRIVDGKEEIHFTNPKRGYVELIHFLNFPQLHITENQVIDCIFENCGEIYLSKDCGHSGCRFDNITALYCTGKFLTHCEFANIQCNGTAFVDMQKCRMGSCSFKNVQLLDDAFLVFGHGSSYVYGCKLDNVTTMRKDGEMFFRDEWHFWPFVNDRTLQNVNGDSQNENL